MRNLQTDQSAVQIVDNLVHTAIDQTASDIHLQPNKDALRVRFRLDGVLHDQEPIHKSIMLQIISRLKVLASMNIAEKRIPQDGKFHIDYKNKPIDLRVSTFPSLYGEKVVIRILDRTTHTMALDQLGLNNDMGALFTKLINRPSGFLLVTGPTGSGKTTTLYAALSVLNNAEKNIVTLEDPVEYNLDGITQGYINPGAGFTFERGIRSLLRQDPDILMVGEIRDKQTARIAIEAALTGHLVLSTLHTNDATSAIMRLMDRGGGPYLINASLTGVLAQRLVRKICATCKKQKNASPFEKELCAQLHINAKKLYHGVGCDTCKNRGYKGRVGIFELLHMTNKLRSLIISQPVFDDIYTRAHKDGMRTLKQDGAQKVEEGIITLEELNRVIV